MNSDTENKLANVVMFPSKEEEPKDIAGYIYERGEEKRESQNKETE
ncbi:hypothetical protein ABLD44_005227 [Salmonella enterica subsp. diarizonae serovar (6),14:z10:z]|nr:hypothetical protein [Salmonella enterica subsp. diarizonae]EMB9153040.1 hypothetical protein [Salmonella enterica]EEA3037396.1 hypothetical protein [Salmonella enterica subsp. diarizonae]EED7444290.1 hypothetical protein [Salmonella enterica subsp. diarizonae]HEA0334076.1 hypothetical protein [Salmonella enterica]